MSGVGLVSIDRIESLVIEMAWLLWFDVQMRNAKRKIMVLRIFGFRVSRYVDWYMLVRLSGREVGWLVLLSGVVLKLLRGGVGVGVVEFRRRVRVCGKCPVYDGELKRCGNLPGLGCGCYVPFLAVAVVRPYASGCWGDEVGMGHGWGVRSGK